MYPKSGFKVITPIQFLNGLALVERKRISFRQFRVYLGAFSISAVREAARRARRRNFAKGVKPVRYRFHEIAKLCGLTEPQVKADLRRLGKAGLLQFAETEILIPKSSLPETAEALFFVRSPTRPIPVPRSVLRFLCQETRQSVSRTMIAYMIRGLTMSRKGAEVSGKGAAKLSWICDLMLLSERGARYARSELIRLGWIARDVNSFQLKLNRDGAYFSINLEWTFSELAPFLEKGSDVEIAPLSTKSSPSFAPPRKYRKTPDGSKNQKTKNAGFLRKGMLEKEEPNLRCVKTEDLFKISHCEGLYRQAVSEGIVPESECSALNFLSAAVRARSIKNGDPAAVFVSIVRKNLWKHITFEQEEVARRALARVREINPECFRARGM